MTFESFEQLTESIFKKNDSLQELRTNKSEQVLQELEERRLRQSSLEGLDDGVYQPRFRVVLIFLHLFFLPLLALLVLFLSLHFLLR